MKKSKIPNFAAIHKKTFERMESISDYKNRKEERTKKLLSVQKSATKGIFGFYFSIII